MKITHLAIILLVAILLTEGYSQKGGSFRPKTSSSFGKSKRYGKSTGAGFG